MFDLDELTCIPDQQCVEPRLKGKFRNLGTTEDHFYCRGKDEDVLLLLGDKWYVDPSSREEIELGTLKHPYKSAE